jgi:1,4-alpha-glucan branching enzyme
MNRERGYLALVLHAHLPFVRHPEHADSLEERWLYEAITETYMPLLLVLEGLVRDGVDFRLTFSVTPTLASMLADPFLQSRYLDRLERMIELAGKEVRRTRSEPALNKVARMYRDRFREVHDAFEKRYARDLLRTFRNLQDLGKIEIMASAATHGYLPLLAATPGAVGAQIATGVEHHQTLFGRKPKGFWLPECGYYNGVDANLRSCDIFYTILETHGVTRADPRPLHGVYAPVSSPAGLAVFGRDPESSKQVWSASEGYPGDVDYREFYRDIGHDLHLDYIGPYIHRDGIRLDTGIKYFRITRKGEHKEPYVPERAERKAAVDAEDFLRKKKAQVEELAGQMPRQPVIVAPFDAELFGHWWFEGPIWIDRLARAIAADNGTVRLITLSEYLAMHPPEVVSAPCPSSWGAGGFNEVWLNGTNDWIYPHLHRAAERMRSVASRHPRARGLRRRALSQAARELLLAQASDWAFMMHTGDMVEYASKRVQDHLLQMHELCRMVESHRVNQRRLASLEKRNNLLPGVRYELFAQ